MIDLDLKLVAEDDPILKVAAEPFDFNDRVFDPVAISVAMLNLMRASNGIGLAAPQVGLPHRLFVMEVLGDKTRACFNPQIVSVSDTTERGDEGCLSFPGLWLKIARPLEVVGEYQDSSGSRQQVQLTGLAARCFLHETDHLNGVRFMDLVGPLALQMAQKRRKSA